MPGDVVRHRAVPEDMAEPRLGVVVCALTERRISSTIHFCDVRWASQCDQYTEGLTRHDPAELLVIRSLGDTT